MPSNEQRRQAAKRKLERQLARRVERARRRRLIAVLATVGSVVVVVGAIVLVVNLGKRGPAPAANAATAPPTATTPAKPAVTSKGPCKYTETPQAPPAAGRVVGLPDDPNPSAKTGTASITLKTSAGDIPITLDRAEAPCTVQSIVHLVTKKFYDNSPCHRLTADQGLSVLQCGDPTGSGSGGPGYSIPDEKPKNLKPAPASAPAQPGQEAADIYPAGTVAMANAGPNTGGSQFFLVYADSQLPPDYTVFGTMSPAGLDVVKKIAAGGITPGQSGPTDGAPKTPVTITQAIENS